MQLVLKFSTPQESRYFKNVKLNIVYLKTLFLFIERFRLWVTFKGTNLAQNSRSFKKSHNQLLNFNCSFLGKQFAI